MTTGETSAYDLRFIGDMQVAVEAGVDVVEWWLEYGDRNDRGREILESFYHRLTEERRPLTERQIDVLVLMETHSAYEKTWPNEKEGYIYAAIDPYTNQVKLGFSKNPKKRAQSMRTERPGLRIETTVWAPACAEVELHRMLESRRIVSEWFERGEWLKPGNFSQLVAIAIDRSLQQKQTVQKKGEIHAQTRIYRSQALHRDDEPDHLSFPTAGH